MDTELRAAQQTVLHVVEVTADIGRTRPHIRLDPIRVQLTVVVVGAAAGAQFLAEAGRVGLRQDLL